MGSVNSQFNWRSEAKVAPDHISDPIELFKNQAVFKPNNPDIMSFELGGPFPIVGFTFTGKVRRPIQLNCELFGRENCLTPNPD